MKKKLNLNTYLVTAGIIVSLYLLYSHFIPGKSICDISSTVSCGYVNTSEYSEIFNLPVALGGLIWFSVLFYIKRKKYQPEALRIWSILGIISIIYFIWAEYMLGAICLFCTAVHILVIIIAIQSFSFKQKLNWKKAITHYKPLIYSLIVIFLILIVSFNLPKQKSLDNFAQCLTEKNVYMYGSYRCGVCAKIKHEFDDSFSKINYIECHPQGENYNAQRCKNLEGTPTWTIEENNQITKKHVGGLSISELAEFSGCPNE